MAKNKGYLVPGTVRTLDDRDKYPVADVNDIAGAKHIKQTDNERFAIPKLRRKLGMECYVVNTGKLFMLVNNPDTDNTTTSDWAEVAMLTSTQVAEFVTNANLNNKLASYAKQTDIPDMTKYYNKVQVDNTFAKINDVYDKSTADQTFALKSDVDDISQTIVELIRPDIISVNYNTDISSITLPTTIDVTYANGTAASLQVTWDTSTYSKTTSGLQVILGSLTLPAGTKNASVNVIQHIIVGAETHVIAQILTTVPVQITAPYDTQFADLALPTRMQVEYEDGTTAYIDVDWSGASSSYDPQTLTAQNLTGTFLLPANVSQPTIPVEPTAIVLARSKPLNIVSDASITLPLVIVETAFEDIGLPTTNTVTLEDNSTKSLKIKWNASSYNPYQIGKSLVIGEYILDDGVLNENNVYPKVVVDVGTKPDICQVIDPPNVSTGTGVAVGDLILPTQVDVKILNHDGTITNGTADVTWDFNDPDYTPYDPNVPGDYYVPGTITPPNNVTNMTGITAELLISVVAGVTYVVSSVPTSLQSVPNGTTVINTPSTVTVDVMASDGTSSTDNASVVWTADPTFDGTVAGTYTWIGEITPSDPNIQNPGQLKAKILVTVEPATTSYFITAVTDAGNGAVTENEPLTSITPAPPNQVIVTVDGTDGSSDPYQCDVIWDYSNISSDNVKVVVTGTNRSVELQGQLIQDSINGLTNVKNPSGLTAKFTVSITAMQIVATTKEVKSVTTVIPNIPFNYGDPVSVLDAALAEYPKVDIEVVDNLDNPTNLTGVAVTWDTSSFDPTRADSVQPVYGTLADLSGEPDPILNTGGVKATVNVIVGSAPVVKTLDSYQTLTPIPVNNGTLEADIPFPTDIIVNCTEGTTQSTHTVPITGWTFSFNNTAGSYDPSVEGNYLFTPVVDLNSAVPSVADHTGNPTVPDVTVSVAAATVNPTDPVTYTSTVTLNPPGNNIALSNFNSQVFDKLKEIDDSGSEALEDAYLGKYNEATDETDIDTRTVELRYLGTEGFPIADPGVRIPLDYESDSKKEAFQNKLISLGVPDGTFGSVVSPIEIASISIISDMTNSSIQFNQSISTAKLMWRFAKTGLQFEEINDPNAY